MQPWIACPVFNDKKTGRRIVLAVIRSYQLVIAPLLIGACRYEPSCSRYAEEAVLTHGALRGSWLALRRVLRCQPFGGAGFDPVPGRAKARHYRRRDADPGSARLLDRRSLGEGGQPGQTEHLHSHF